jgi:hypothetical protein
MVAQMPRCNDISPTLRDIIALFDEENKRTSHGLSPGQVPVMEDGIVDGNDADNNDSMLPDSESWDFGGCDDHEDAYDENYNPVGSNTMNYQEVFSCRLGKIEKWSLAKIMAETQLNLTDSYNFEDTYVSTKYVATV